MAANGYLDIATKAFKKAEEYDRVREKFSLQSAVLVLTRLGILEDHSHMNGIIREKKVVLELAAGTGKFTEVLVRALGDTNVKLISSEPVESMATVFKEKFPDVEFLCCISEQIPLPDSSVHAIVAGNATHFISNPNSFAEMARVLVPGGGLGFVTLQMDPTLNPWCLEFYQLSASYYKQIGLYMQLDDHGVEVGWKKVLEGNGRFGEIGDDRSDCFVQATTEDATLDCLMAYGAFARCDKEERTEVRQKLRSLLERNYRGVGKTMTELPLRSIVFHALKTSENGKR